MAQRSGRRRIGITSYGREPGPRGETYAVAHAYLDAVRRAGAEPRPVLPGRESPSQVLREVDALIFTGGGDLDPALSGGRPHPSIYSIDAERDAFELELMRGALAGETPLLAVCRGMQVLNVARGGTLHPHMPDVYGEAIAHRTLPLAPVEHPVELEPDSRLAKIYGTTKLEIASVHHQSVDRPGEGLRVVAWAPDGVTEALELEGCDGVLAVQWHPELQEAHEGSPQRRVFAELVALASRGPRRLG